MKNIRFIDTQYNTLFVVPDGGFVRLTYNSTGAVKIKQVHYIDECHFSLVNVAETQQGLRSYGIPFHILQFAENMKRANITYERSV